MSNFGEKGPLEKEILIGNHHFWDLLLIKNIQHQLIGRLTHDLQGFKIHPRWFSRRISEPSTVFFVFPPSTICPELSRRNDGGHFSPTIENMGLVRPCLLFVICCLLFVVVVGCLLCVVSMCCVLFVVCCLLFVVCCVLSVCVVCCLLFAVCCLLFVVCVLSACVARCVLCVVCCLLFAVCCLLCVVGMCCVLFVVCCLLCVVCYFVRSLSFFVILCRLSFVVCLFVCLGAGCCGLSFVNLVVFVVVVVVICFVAAAVLKMHDSQATTFGSRCFNK